MSLPAVRDAYTARSAEYIDLLGSIEDAAEQDRQYVLAWAQGADGRIVDVGCGPGQWTNFLHENGLEVEAVDPVPEFIAHARRRYPGVVYRIGDAGRLGVEGGSLGGVLAWYSLIHTPPASLGAILGEFARCLRPGGRLLIGFCEGPELVAFDHAVTTAYYWPIDLLSARIEQAGFVVTDTQARHDPGSRPHGAITAERRS
jgi:SAM-dependent methyltransferase